MAGIYPRKRWITLTPARWLMPTPPGADPPLPEICCVCEEPFARGQTIVAFEYAVETLFVHEGCQTI